MSYFFKNTIKSIIVFISNQKLPFFLLTVFAICGIAFGVENVILLKDDIDLTDITDICFVNASKAKWQFYTFYFTRLSILILPILISIFSFHIGISLINCIISFTNAYFFSFNFAVLLFNLKIVGLVYVFLVCLPCYLIYLLCLTVVYLISFSRSTLKKEYNNFFCFKKSLKEIRAPLIYVFLIFSLAVFYEIFFLYIIYNKYIFAMC